MTLYLLNLAGLLFTIHAIRHGGVELNPFMQSIPLQIFYKVFVIGFLLWVLTKVNSRLARFGLNVCTAVFAVVNVWHIYNIVLKG